MEITPRIQRLLDQQKIYESGDLVKAVDLLRTFLDSLIFLNETLSDIKLHIPHWKMDSGTLVSKLFQHGLSFSDIIEGTQMKSTHVPELNGIRLFDRSAAAIMLRAILEAFLTYRYIYVNPSTEAEREYRYQILAFASLHQRQSFPHSTEFAKARKKEDQIIISQIKEYIESQPNYDGLTEKEWKAFYKRPKPRLKKGWREILEESGFSKSHTLHTQYAVLSSHAHSEGLSLMQLRGSSPRHSSQMVIASIWVEVASQIVCMLIEIIKNEYPAISVRFNGLNTNLQDHISVMAEKGRRLNHSKS